MFTLKTGQREAGNAKIIVPVVIVVIAVLALLFVLTKSDDAPTPETGGAGVAPQTVETPTDQPTEQPTESATAPDGDVVDYTYAQLLPEKTLAYIGISDIDKTKADFETTALSKILSEPDIRKLISDVWEKITKQIAEGGPEGGMLVAMLDPNSPMVTQALDLLHGQVCIALTDLDLAQLQNTMPQIVLIADAGDKEQQNQITGTIGLLATLVSSQAPGTENGAYEYKGADIITMTNNAAVLARTIHKGQFILCSSREAMEGVIDGLENASTENLTTHDSFAALQKKMGSDSEILMYLGLGEILDKFKSQIPVQAGPILAELGILGIRSAGYTTTIESNGFFVDRIFIHLEGERSGITKILSLEPVSEEVVKLVPQESIGFSATTINIAGIWDETKRILSAVNPQALEQIQMQMANLKTQMGIDVEGDIINNLSKGMVAYNAFTSSSEYPDMVGLIGLENGAAFRSTLLEKLLPLAAFMVQFNTEEYQGQTLYFVDIPAGVTTGQQGLTQVGFVVTDNHLMIASSPAAIKQAMDQSSSATSILQNALYQEASKRIPVEGHTVSFSDAARAVEVGLNNLEGALSGIPDLPFDFSMLPDSKVISQHLAPGIGRMISEEDGIFMEVDTLAPMPVVAAGAGGIAALVISGQNRNLALGEGMGRGGSQMVIQRNNAGAGNAQEAAPEADVIRGLRSLAMAEETHYAVEGRYATLEELCQADPPYLAKSFASGMRGGYQVTLTVSESGWFSQAAPVEKADAPYFFMDQSGVVRQSNSGPATKDSPPVE